MIKKGPFIAYAAAHPAVSALAGINLFFYLFTLIPAVPSRWLIEQMTGVNILIANGEWWRVITPVFIHNHFHHLLFNSIALFLVGSLLEEHIKKTTLLFMYFSSGIFANIITYLFAPVTYVHTGSSGAVFGLFGVFAVFMLYQRLFHREGEAVGLFILFAFMLTFFDPDTNVYAHLGGFLWGCVCGFFFARKM